LRPRLKEKTSVKLINFHLLPFLDGESSFKDPRSIPPIVTQVVLKPGLSTVSSGRWGKMVRRRSINYKTILHLDMFCKKEGKWNEVPYIQLFFFLRDHPKLLRICRLDTQTMVTLHKKPQTPLSQQKHLRPKGSQ
jgi:hypothetical protein